MQRRDVRTLAKYDRWRKPMQIPTWHPLKTRGFWQIPCENHWTSHTKGLVKHDGCERSCFGTLVIYDGSFDETPTNVVKMRANHDLSGENKDHLQKLKEFNDFLRQSPKCVCARPRKTRWLRAAMRLNPRVLRGLDERISIKHRRNEW